MNKLSCTTLALLFPIISNAVTLDGTWQSDKEKTLKWNSEHSKIDPSELKKLSYILGHTYLMYNAGKALVYFDSYEINGKKIEPLCAQESTYKVIAENDHGVVIKQSYSDGSDVISMLIFESNNSFYGATLDTEDYGKPGHRDYFKKISEPAESNQIKSACVLK